MNPALALAVDGLIIVLYFAVILYIGLTVGRRENTLEDFALGGRNVPWWAVMASVLAAEVSAATFLNTPGEGYALKSLVYAQLVIGVILGRILVGYIFLKPYFRYRVYTVYDYLQIRFGNWSKNYVSALFLIARTLASGSRVFIPATVMVLAYRMIREGGHANDFAMRSQDLRLYFIGIILVTVFTCAYTAVGGIKAVIWTDVVQAAMMFGCALLAIGTLLYHVGGSLNLLHGFAVVGRRLPDMKTHMGYFWLGWEPERVQSWLSEQATLGRKPYLRSDGSPSWWEWVHLTLGSEYTLASALIANTLGNMAAFGTDQDMVQRLLTAKTAAKSRRSLVTAAFADLPIAAAFSFIGVLLFVYFDTHSEFKPAANKDVFGSFILNVMPVGIRGLILSGVFATSMGSLSAALNALATSATNDWYIPFFAPHRDGSHHVRAARIFTVIFAILMIIVACVIAYVTIKLPATRIIPLILGIAGLFFGPMLGVFLLGMTTRTRGSDLGNTIALSVSFIAMLFLSGNYWDFLNMLHPASAGAVPLRPPDWLPIIKWTWFAMFGALIVYVVGMLFRTPDAIQQACRARDAEAQLQEQADAAA